MGRSAALKDRRITVLPLSPSPSFLVDLPSKWLSGGGSGGAAKGHRKQPAHPEDLPLPQPADGSLPVAGQLLLPSSAGCHLQVHLNSSALSHFNKTINSYKSTAGFIFVLIKLSYCIHCVAGVPQTQLVRR